MIAVLHVPVSNLLIRQKQTASIIFTEPLHNLIWLLLYLTEEKQLYMYYHNPLDDLPTHFPM